MARGPMLVGASVAAAAVFGVALWVATGSDDAAREGTGTTKPEPSEPAASPVETNKGRERPSAVRGGIKPASASAKGDARTRGGAVPSVEPVVSLDRARKDFADIIAELEGVAAQGRRLTQPEYLDVYKRGNEALLPLQQHLDWQEPEEAEELRTAQTEFRAKLREVEPRPGG